MRAPMADGHGRLRGDMTGVTLRAVRRFPPGLKREAGVSPALPPQL